MQRVLDPAQIEAFAQQQIPRVRLPDPGTVFAARGERLLALAKDHPLAGYLELMALVCEAQQRSLGTRAGQLLPEPLLAEASRAVRHEMPPLPAVGLTRTPLWREILEELCAALKGAPNFPAQVGQTVERLAAAPPRELEQQADALLSGAGSGVDVPCAPVLMAALQVHWTLRVLQLPVELLAKLPQVNLVCPLCGSLPVASIVQSGPQDQHGLRYMSCGLCASQWHLVRVKCSHCESTAGIHYQSIEGGPDSTTSKGIRAEVCGACRTYRKIFYREDEPAAEPVADDLASIALDLLVAEAGFHRASGNPLLWQPVNA